MVDDVLGGACALSVWLKDWIEKAKDGNERADRKDWVRSHCCGYTFVNDEFIPNPDFKIPHQDTP